jgi:hypothetical protein
LVPLLTLEDAACPGPLDDDRDEGPPVLLLLPTALSPRGATALLLPVDDPAALPRASPSADRSLPPM